MDEHALVAAACRGSAASFNELARRHADAAYSVACRLLGRADEAGDATEEALLAAYRALPAWAGGSFGAWLLRFVVRACRERRRAVAAGLAGGAGPHHDALRAAEAAIAGLPWEERVAVVLADVQGLSYGEIAQVTGASAAGVRRRLHEGRARLGRELACQWPGRGLSTGSGNGLGGLGSPRSAEGRPGAESGQAHVGRVG